MARRYDLDAAREAVLLEALTELREAEDEMASAKISLKAAKEHVNKVLDKCGLEKALIVDGRIMTAVSKRSAEDGPLFGGRGEDDQAPMGLVRHGPYTAER